MLVGVVVSKIRLTLFENMLRVVMSVCCCLMDVGSFIIPCRK